MAYHLVILFSLSCLYFELNAAAETRYFPPYFKFGAATAAYQIEGAWNEDGKGESIWDHLSHTNPDFFVNQDNADIACDSYHKYKEDVALLKELGVDYYRFSISWARIVPLGIAGSPVNKLGIDYYRNLSQELLDNGIEPMATIYHWDLPQRLQDIGGWPNPDLEEHYAYYARIVFEQLGDLIKKWMTFNEPKQTCLMGYGNGGLAPAITATGLADYKCSHTLLKSHARAYHLYDEKFRAEQGGTVGIVIDTSWYEPADGSEQNLEAAERGLQFAYGWYASPIVYGNYPQVMIDRIGNRSQQQGFAYSRLPRFTEEESSSIKGTYDFIAINAYSSHFAYWKEETDVSVVGYDSDLNINLFDDVSWEETGASWQKVVPWGLRKLVNWVSKTYGHPEIYITENGYTDNTGELEDERRVNYYREYLSNLLEAILDDGVNVTRYTAWSLLDNFEWGSAYRYGLYNVNFDDPERPRTPKASAKYYSKVATTKCLIDECVE